MSQRPTELQLHFLGSRAYIQGTTLFDALVGYCRHARNISFRIAKLIETDRVGVQQFDPNLSGTSPFSATLMWDEAGARTGLGIVPLVPSPSPSRVPFDEAAIIGRAKFDVGAVTTCLQESDTLAKTVVALNKALLLRQLQGPAPGQWLFVRLDLVKCFDTFNTLRIKLRSNVGFAAVSSSIEIDGDDAGSVVFSWLKR